MSVKETAIISLIVILAGKLAKATETCKYDYKCSSYNGACTYNTRTCDDICCDDKTKSYDAICCSSNSNTGAVAGGAVGGIIALIIVLFICYYCFCYTPTRVTTVTTVVY